MAGCVGSLEQEHTTDEPRGPGPLPLGHPRLWGSSLPFAAREREKEDGGSAWRRIVTADSEDEAFNRLLDAVRGGDKVILPAGRSPNRGEGS